MPRFDQQHLRRMTIAIGEAHQQRRETGFGFVVRSFGNIGPAPRTCQYIPGEPKETPKCGKPVHVRKNGERSPYCKEHHRVCYIPYQKRRHKRRARA